MDTLGFAVVAAGLVGFSLVSARLRSSSFTPPMAAIAFGLVIGSAGLGLADLDLSHGAIHVLAEITLVVVLFTDAARIDLDLLKRDHDLPIRMLVVGLPITIAAGTLMAWGVFGHFSIWEAALLAAILAPTDAALGQSVVSHPRVPARIRQALNVESGLNDGIALPVVLMLAAVASNIGGGTEGTAHWVRFAVLQVTLGPLVGVAIGVGGAWLIDRSVANGWITTSFEGLSMLGIAFLGFALAELVGGNGFIAAFVGGMVFGNTVRHRCEFLFEFGEAEGQLLALATFLVFGAAMLPLTVGHLGWPVMGYAIASLTIVRMLPVALSLTGARLSWRTHLFLGWFGPRGLASILFALLILEQAEIPHREELLVVTIITVALSALAHGATAAPMANRYAAIVASRGECPETMPVSEMPTRHGMPSVPGGH